jgi:hypothetical protein
VLFLKLIGNSFYLCFQFSQTQWGVLKPKKMKRYQLSVKSFSLIITFCFVLSSWQILLSQGSSSSVGDRENIGIFGGHANDLSWAVTGNRLFAAVHNPGTLFYSDDNATTWIPAFPFDSLEFNFGLRGWGGGAYRVITNNIGWVLVHTGVSVLNLSAATISYNNGVSFKTAVDPFYMTMLTGQNKKVTATGLSDHYLYAACENFLLRINDTIPFGPNMIILDLNQVPSLEPGSKIVWVSPSNSLSGYPLYVVTESPSGTNKLWKCYESVVMELILPGSGIKPLNVFTHGAQITGDTLFASAVDQATLDIYLFRSLNGGFIWTNITPAAGISAPLADADYSPAWVLMMPASNGLRLSFAGGIISDDLGANWQGPGAGLLNFGIATHPGNTYTIVGSNNVGVAISLSGITGTFAKTDNIGFENITVRDMQNEPGAFYVATEAGLAFTSEYYNPNVTGYERWNPPNGLFPVPNTGNIEGVSSVAIDPFNTNHVICGSSDGFYVTFNGPSDFFDVIPSGWNSNGHLDPYVTDIVFLNSNIIIAVTGFKERRINSLPPIPAGNIWRSTDGGMNWTIVTPSQPEEYTMGNCLTSVNTGTQLEIFSGTGYRNNTAGWIPGVLWKSTDMGLTWQKINDAPVFGSSDPLPIYDIDFDPNNSQLMYLSADMVLARSFNSGQTYFITDIPYNTGILLSALIVPTAPDSIYVTSGRILYKYSYLIDDADIKFKGLPGEFFNTSAFGSVLAGSNTGVGEIAEAPTYDLDLKVYIEGAFNGTEMTTTLNSLGFLPLTQPFNKAPWFYSGTEHVASIPNSDVVDWILVEIRITDGDSSTATAKTMFERKAGFLLKDGTIVDDDGVTPLRFSVILATSKGSDKIHGVVYSPGQSGERTATEMASAKNSTFSYNFTTGPNQAYGGASAHKEIAPGIWGMRSGDGDQDGIVDNRDKNGQWLTELGNYGYYYSDYNRDGVVDLADKEDFWVPNAGMGNKIE